MGHELGSAGALGDCKFAEDIDAQWADARRYEAKATCFVLLISSSSIYVITATFIRYLSHCYC